MTRPKAPSLSLGERRAHALPRWDSVESSGDGNIATQSDDETVTFHAARFDRAKGARIHTLNLPGELDSHASGASDLTRLCTLMADGRLEGQIELEASWREPSRALEALLERRIGGKPCSTSTDLQSRKAGIDVRSVALVLSRCIGKSGGSPRCESLSRPSRIGPSHNN
jgi:hypothetical protein